MDEQIKDSIRFQTLSLNKIDAETIGMDTKSEWRQGNQDRSEWLSKRESWTQNWRDLNKQGYQGPWENSSDFNVPITLFYGKAIHARLWQLFSDGNNFFGVKARKEIFQEQEEYIREFMRFVLNDYANCKQGTKDVFDEALWDNVFDGSAFLKVYWQKDEHKYLEVVPVDIS